MYVNAFSQQTQYNNNNYYNGRDFLSSHNYILRVIITEIRAKSVKLDAVLFELFKSVYLDD